MSLKRFFEFLSGEGRKERVKRVSALRKVFKVFYEAEKSDGQLRESYGQYDVRFPYHPFNLELPFDPDFRKKNREPAEIREADYGLHFVGWPYYTDVSVYAMLYAIGRKLYFTNKGLTDLKEMRRIFVERKDSNDHQVYYEMVFSHHSSICGGCDDYSEGVGSAAELDEVFKLVEKMSLGSHRTGIRDIFMPYDEGYCRRKLSDLMEDPPWFE